MREKDRDRLLRRSAREGTVDIIAPKLVAHRTHGARRGCIRNASDLKIQGAKGEIGCLRRRSDEGK